MLSFDIKYDKIKYYVNKLLANINSLYDNINNSNTKATEIKNNADIVVANISDQTINKTEYNKAIADKVVIDTSKAEVEKQYKIADKIKTAAINISVPTLLQSINDGITQIYNGFKTLVSTGFNDTDNIEVDKFINDATSELDAIKKEKNKFNLKINDDVNQLELQIQDIEKAVAVADPKFKTLIDTNNQFINYVMNATSMLVENIKNNLRPNIDAKNQEIIQALKDIKTKNNDDIVEPDNTAVISHNVYKEIKAVTNQIVDDITLKSNTTNLINTKFADDLEKIQKSFEDAAAKLKNLLRDVGKFADDLKSVEDIHKEIIADNIITKFDIVLTDIGLESVKLDPYIKIAELMEYIGKKHVETIKAKEDTKAAAEETTKINDEVIAFASDAQAKADEADNTEQTAISLIGSISDKDVSSELAKLKRQNNEMGKLNQNIRTKPGDPLKKAATAKTDADTALDEADKQLATFTTVDAAVLYTNDLKYWIAGTNYNTEKANAKNAAKAAKTTAETAKKNAEDAENDANAALADTKTKINNINIKIALIRSIFDRIKQLVDAINNEDDDDTKEQSATQQQDDDKVKPFSQNSYDILPLDPKVATLSSNMQFSESKSTATNNPGNSFMYTIVPYDSQELSSDDRVLEIVSFARTQRMPIKDATNIIAKADELLKKYRGTKKVIPGAWVYRGGKLFSSVKPTKIEELERYIELMRRSLMR